MQIDKNPGWHHHIWPFNKNLKLDVHKALAIEWLLRSEM